MAKKDAQSFEAQMQRLQDIVKELEQPDLSLERNVALYKEGRKLAQSCKGLLENARAEILLCTDEGAVPFSVEAEGAGI